MNTQLIAVIETQTEVNRFIDILHEEAERERNKNGGILDLTQEAVYGALLERAKIRYRAWQMEQPGFDESGSAHEYKMQSLRDSLLNKYS